MNDLIKIDGPAVTMTSREIADLTGKRHDHVLRDIRAMLVELHGEDRLPSFGDTLTDPQNGQSYPIFVLPKRETLILVSGYSLTMRAKIIDRWQELEEQARNPILAMNRMDLLKLALDSEERRVELESKVAVMAPKVQALERIALSDGSLCITDAAKTLQVQPHRLTKLLQEKQWIYRRPMGSGYLAYQDRIQSGLLEHKVTRGEKGDGSEWSSTQARVTPKGLTKLAEIVQQAGFH